MLYANYSVSLVKSLEKRVQAQEISPDFFSLAHFTHYETLQKAKIFIVNRQQKKKRKTPVKLKLRRFSVPSS